MNFEIPLEYFSESEEKTSHAAFASNKRSKFHIFGSRAFVVELLILCFVDKDIMAAWTITSVVCKCHKFSIDIL